MEEEGGGEEGGKGGGGETVEEGQEEEEETMEIEVAKEREEAASEQGEGSVYFFLTEVQLGQKYSILCMYVSRSDFFCSHS